MLLFAIASIHVVRIELLIICQSIFNELFVIFRHKLVHFVDLLIQINVTFFFISFILISFESLLLFLQTIFIFLNIVV
jgi:hypothetical protein